MAAALNDTELCMCCNPFNPLNLLECSVFVVDALYGKNGALDLVQVLLDVPVAELGIQPHIVPSPERRVRMFVVPCKALGLVGIKVGFASPLDILDRNVFDEDMRCSHNNGANGIR